MEHKYLFVAVDAALKAGEEILSIYTDPASDFEIERKADHSPLTIADRKAHVTIATILNETPFPVLSEEGKHLEYDTRRNWDVMWIVDPLDGTKEFIKRNGEFTVNIALVKAGVPIIGVIYLPVKKRTFDKLVAASVRLPQDLQRDRFVVVASRSHLTPETEAYIDAVKQEHKHVELISSGSSIKICLVAEGKADVYPRFAPTMEWDTAAGHAIARAAGMEIYQADKKDVPLQYNKEDLLNPWFIVEKRR